jgi:hypothetical protein
MILTTPELIASLQNEVRILLHLAGKLEPSMLDYRPTAKQRSTIELLRYLSVMGPMLVKATKAGGFDPAAWKVELDAANARNFEQTLAAIAAHRDEYASLISSMSDADFRIPIEMFGNKTTRGAFIVNSVLAAYAAYRTQLFLYLKSCGRTDLGTSNLWGGVDPPVSV